MIKSVEDNAAILQKLGKSGLFQEEKALADWLRSQQNCWAEQGLPTRKDEEWRRFPWQKFAWEKVSPATCQKSFSPEEQAQWPRRAEAKRLVLVDGVFSKEYSDELDLFDGVICQSWQKAVSNPFAQTHIMRDWKIQSGWQLINNLCCQGGLFLYLPEHCELPSLHILSVTTESASQKLQHLRFGVQVDQRAKLSVWVDHHTDKPVEQALVNQQVTLSIAEYAAVDWVICQRESGVQRVEHNQVDQANNASFTLRYVGLETDLVRSEWQVVSQGEESQTRLTGWLFPKGKEAMALHSQLTHEQPNTEAEQRFRVMAADQGQGIFQGKVLVQPGAQKTHSTQYCNSLLLGDGAKASACPQLEIYADDVVCSHGATVGQLDEMQLFYLCSRGLSEQEAKTLLLQGFTRALLPVSEHVFYRDLEAVLEAHWQSQELS